MGGENAVKRIVGKWTFKEQIELVKSIEKATQLQVIIPEIKIKYKESSRSDKNQKFKFSKNKLRIFKNDSLNFADVLSLLLLDDIEQVKSNLIKKSVSQISWQAISESMETKSSDDIRHFWNAKILPLLVPNQNSWSEKEDLALLQFVSDEDLRGQGQGVTLAQSQNSIAFDGLKDEIKTKSEDQCRSRWFVLLKGLGSYNPG